MQILLAEDEVVLSNAVKKILEQQGYFVDTVYDGEDAVYYAQSVNYQLIVLDIMIPKIDGFEVVSALRKKGIVTPVLMLTAKTATADKVKGLNFGADDYMTKPFDTEELLARINALTRRKGDVVVSHLTYGDLSLNIHSAILSCKEKSVQLSRKEFDVMKLFLYNPTATVTTDTVITNVWGTDSEATNNNVEVYISFLRKKLKYLGSAVSFRKLQRLGYRLEVHSS